jgi:Protein of unknown function (DUF1826)
MNLQQLFQPWTERAHVHFAASPHDLQKVRLREINLAIHQRKPDVQLQCAVKTLVKSSFTKLELLIDTATDFPLHIRQQLALRTSLQDQQLESLANDIATYTLLFSQVCESNRVKLYLKTVTDDSCRKFHIDGYAYRLFCSYVGPGTEWTYNDNVNRKFLGLGENEQIIKNLERIERLETFDVAILKGELPTQRSGKGIVHRSPAIEYKQEKRLILRIDSQ